jgi:hypothetical protein
VTENGKGGARPVGLGLTGFASAPAADTVAELSDVERAALERAAELMTRLPRAHLRATLTYDLSAVCWQ